MDYYLCQIYSSAKKIRKGKFRKRFRLGGGDGLCILKADRNNNARNMANSTSFPQSGYMQNLSAKRRRYIYYYPCGLGLDVQYSKFCLHPD